jgi:hypothetical protein
MPHIKYLNLGAKQLGVDVSRTSEASIPPDIRDNSRVHREIVLDEIQSLLTRYYPARRRREKDQAGTAQEAFQASWTEMEKLMPLSDLRAGYDALHIELEGEKSKLFVCAGSAAGNERQHSRLHSDPARGSRRMTDLGAFSGTYADWKLIKTRSVVQVVFEIPVENSNAVLQVLGGMPDGTRWFGIAPINLSPPVEKEKPAEPRPTTPKSPAGAKRDWRDIPPPQQAGIRCDEPIFAAFLKEQHPLNWREATRMPAECVRLICVVAVPRQPWRRSASRDLASTRFANSRLGRRWSTHDRPTHHPARTAFSVARSTQKRPRVEDAAHLKWIRTCDAVSAAPGPDPAHIRSASALTESGKPEDLKSPPTNGQSRSAGRTTTNSTRRQ